MDGFNLYHALSRLRKPHLKWVDLWKLLENFVDPVTQKLTAVYYFSAYATWLPGPHSRHQQYVAALQSRGVIPIMGHFKDKERSCNGCNAKWISHEEKETDVNLALWLLNEGYKNSYDIALVVSRDSDLAPAVRMVRNEFPPKRVKIIAPPGLRHSKELAQAVDKKALSSIKEIHLERSLLAEDVRDEAGNLVARRPSQYAPSTTT